MTGFVVCNMTFRNLNEYLEKMYNDAGLLEAEIKSFIMDKEYELKNISSKVKGIVTNVILDITPYITFSVISDFYLSQEELCDIKDRLAEILKDKFVVIEEDYSEDIFDNSVDNLEVQEIFSLVELNSMRLLMKNIDYGIFTGIVFTNRVLTTHECPVEIFNSLKEKISSNNFCLLEKAELYVLMKFMKAINASIIKALFQEKNIVGYDSESFFMTLSNIGRKIEKAYFSLPKEKELKQNILKSIENNKDIIKSKISELKEYRDELLLDVDKNLELIKSLTQEIYSLEKKL